MKHLPTSRLKIIERNDLNLPTFVEKQGNYDFLINTFEPISNHFQPWIISILFNFNVSIYFFTINIIDSCVALRLRFLHTNQNDITLFIATRQKPVLCILTTIIFECRFH